MLPAASRSIPRGSGECQRRVQQVLTLTGDAGSHLRGFGRKLRLMHVSENRPVLVTEWCVGRAGADRGQEAGRVHWARCPRRCHPEFWSWVTRQFPQIAAGELVLVPLTMGVGGPGTQQEAQPEGRFWRRVQRAPKPREPAPNPGGDLPPKHELTFGRRSPSFPSAPLPSGSPGRAAPASSSVTLGPGHWSEGGRCTEDLG